VYKPLAWRHLHVAMVDNDPKLALHLVSQKHFPGQTQYRFVRVKAASLPHSHKSFLADRVGLVKGKGILSLRDSLPDVGQCLSGHAERRMRVVFCVFSSCQAIAMRGLPEGKIWVASPSFMQRRRIFFFQPYVFAHRKAALARRKEGYRIVRCRYTNSLCSFIDFHVLKA
jgi:hypothetical protein